MGQDRIESEVFRDVEKFYKVLGYYEGQELKPIASLESHVDRALETSLRNESVYIRRLQYLLFMMEATCEGRQVFHTDRPETSLTYALFSEGIQALAILRDLASIDLKEWCEVVRQTLVDFDEGRSDKDLASVLWRSPSRNIRCKIYNALLDLETTSDSATLGEEDKKAKAKSNWHTRDQEWETPDGEKVDRNLSNRLLGAQSVSNAKNQLMSMAMNPMLPDEFKIGKKELEFLSEELSSFDQNHVDYNLLHWYLRQLSGVQGASNEVQRLVENLLTTLAQGVISRFHPGLIFLLLGSIQKLDPIRFKVLQEELEKTITNTLRKPANEKRLLASLKHPERSQLTKKLLPYLDPKQFTSIVHFYLGTQDKEGLAHFLKIIVEKHGDSINHMFFSWGEDLLCEIFSSLRGLTWPGRSDFLLRSLKSTSVRIQKEAAKLICEINLASDQAIRVYEASSDESREAWLQGLLDANPVDSWRAFVVRSIESGAWLKFSDNLLKGKLSLLWLRLATHYLQGHSWVPFVFWVQKRRFWFWPGFPELREVILNHFVMSKVVRGNKEFQKLCELESNVRFQSDNLKNQLSVAARGK